MKTLAYAKDLSFPLDAVTQRFAFLGRIGSGKSYASSRLAELMLDAGTQVVALDPVGVWYGLRVAGSGAGYAIPVFGGLHGDMPVESTGGALLADLVVDRKLSCVVDVSQFESDAEKSRFAAAFAERFFFRKKASPSAVHLFLEECQEFIPQNPAKGEEMMLHRWTRMAKLGRNFGIGLSLISQRPQEVNKKVLNLTECLVAFQMVGTHERKAIREWTSAKGADQDLYDELPLLAVGESVVYSPQWISVFRRGVRATRKRSGDVSSTPAVGASAVASKPLTKVDIEALREKMAATVERAKQDDPKALRQRIAQLERELRAAGTGQVDRATVASQVDAAVAAARQEERAHVGPLYAAAKEALSALERVDAAVRAYVAEDARPAPAVRTMSQLRAIGDAVARGAERSGDRGAGERARRPAAAPAAGVSPSEQKVLDAAALIERTGASADVAATGFFAGYSPGGRYNNILGSLRSKGLLEPGGSGTVTLTAEGRGAARADGAGVQSLADLHALWLSKLPPSESRVLVCLLDSSGPLLKRELGERTDYSEGGRFNNILGRLRTLGAIYYPGPGLVAASPNLYPKGLY